jgi:hypothetical protein
MVLKTFNVQEGTYGKFSRFCKDRGMSMSKQIEIFMASVVEKEPEAKEEYLRRLDRIRKQKAIHIGGADDFRKRYGLS